jgi:hypothetical protein
MIKPILKIRKKHYITRFSEPLTSYDRVTIMAPHCGPVDVATTAVSAPAT